MTTKPEKVANMATENPFGYYDDHTQTHEHATLFQLALFIIWLGTFGLFLIRLPKRLNGNSSENEPKKGVEGRSEKEKEKESIAIEIAENNENDKKKPQNNNTDAKKSEHSGKETPTPSPVSRIPTPPTFDQFLQAVVTFGAIMFYFYLCDYKKIFPNQERTYDRDIFLFLVFMLFVIGCCYTLKPCPEKLLNRDQTEEWKGWMQVMFVWYHYFKAAEWYNWIRIYIAAYVWMTGFGNFSFFWIKNDYSLWRMLKMLFRLNFLVIFVFMVMKNEYILYYIPAMHTYWFFSVYFFMYIFQSWNTQPAKMAVKFAAYFVFNALVFEVPGVFQTLFYPLRPFLKFQDGKHDPMHEWEFRLGLDHWVCFVGMLCAYNYPHWEAFMEWLENKTNKTKKRDMVVLGIKAIIGGLTLFVLYIWYYEIMILEKLSYNKLHPYTSFIPVVAYIILRNLSQRSRQYHVALFAWLGKITLETYLSQLHIYLQSNAKHLIGYLPGYHLLNFSLATLIYIPISYVLFNLTTDISAYLIPKKHRTILKNAVIGLAMFAVSYLLAFALRHLALV